MFHGSELPFVFGSTDFLLTAQERDLAFSIEGYWASFAATGAPAGREAAEKRLYPRSLRVGRGEAKRRPQTSKLRLRGRLGPFGDIA